MHQCWIDESTHSPVGLKHCSRLSPNKVIKVQPRHAASHTLDVCSKVCGQCAIAVFAVLRYRLAEAEVVIAAHLLLQAWETRGVLASRQAPGSVPAHGPDMLLKSPEAFMPAERLAEAQAA